MKELPKGGLIGKSVHFIKELSQLQISVYASHACYFIVLAVFPMLVLLLGLLRYTGLQIDYLIQLLEGVIPEALLPTAEKLIISTYRNTSGVLVSASALIMLWSASRGIHGIRTGLNAIYHVSEDRGYFYTRGISVVYTVLFVLVLLLTLVLNVFGTTLLERIPLEPGSLLSFLNSVVDFRFFLLLGIQIAVFSGVFMVLPNRHNKFMDSLPGALLSSIGWLVFSDLYSIYVEKFAALSNVYGSVYAVALSMLWLYCCITIVFYGGALNYYLMHGENGQE